MRSLFASSKQKVFCLIVALAANPVFAGEFAASFTGFATYTAFSNQDWHESSGKVAVNAAAFYGNAAIKAQVANDDHQPVRRFAVEYSLPFERNNVLIQLGRLPRLNTLFSDVYGNPAEWGMAVLPLSTYNRRKVHSLAFQSIEGIKVQYDRGLSFGNLRTTLNYGTAIQEHTHEWQAEAFRRVIPSWDFDGDPRNSGDVAFELTAGNWTVLASHNKVAVNTVLLDPRNRGAVALTTLNKGLDYRFTRLGIRYNTQHGYIQTEHGESRNYYVRTGGDVLESSAWDDYYLGGWYVTDNLTAFGGYATGQKRGSLVSRDRFVGATYRDGRWTYTAELHDGNGAWAKHDGLNTIFNWDRVWVGSVTVMW